MILLALILLPALGALGAYAHRAAAYRTVWLVTTATLHLGLAATCWISRPASAFNDWVGLDALGLVILSLVSVLFFVLATYTVGYLRTENPRGGRAFVSCLLAFLASASLVAVSQHAGLLWVGMESTTLAVAPLIFHKHDRRSLEAVWKYLVISSVGIALALLGTFFLATAQSSGSGTGRPLVLNDLMTNAHRLDADWLKAAFIFLLVGFGTKMGLAPMHTWKPDTYGEAPSPVAALMASALTACAFLGVARVTQVAFAAGIGGFARPLLVGFGLLSLGVAAAFVVSQRDVKRLLAYSSVEHMGLVALGLGLGGVASYGTVLHVVTTGLANALLFLAVGNVVVALGTSAHSEVRGLLTSLPISGGLLLLGLFAVTGSPPFGPFLSTFTILSAATEGHPWITAIAVLLLAIVFAGMARMVLEMVYGGVGPSRRKPRESLWLVGGPLGLAAAVLALGLYLPGALRQALGEAAVLLGGRTP